MSEIYIYIYIYIYILAGLKSAVGGAQNNTQEFFSIYQTSYIFAPPKNGWGMLVYAPGWSLASQF